MALRSRFETLDLLRGVAALTILVVHAPWPDRSLPERFSMHLPVDLFFILSGFVLAHAYGAELTARRLSFTRFLAVRLVRLYPLYIAGTVVAAVVVLYYQMKLDPPLVAMAHIGPALALAAAFLPSFGTVPAAGDPLFALNGPAWSLFWEMLVNLAFAAWVIGARARYLAVIVALAFAALALQTALYGTTKGGWDEATWPMGFGRAFFGFFAGVLVFRLTTGRALPSLHGAWLAAAFLVPVLAIPQSANWVDLSAIAVVFPVLIALGSQAHLGPRFRSAARLFGALSYPVYVLQEPAMRALHALWHFLFDDDLERHGALYPAMFIAVTIIGSWVALRLFDEPARAWLNRQGAGRAGREAAQSAP